MTLLFNLLSEPVLRSLGAGWGWGCNGGRASRLEQKPLLQSTGGRVCRPDVGWFCKCRSGIVAPQVGWAVLGITLKKVTSPHLSFSSAIFGTLQAQPPLALTDDCVSAPCQQEVSWMGLKTNATTRLVRGQHDDVIMGTILTGG